MLQNVVNLVAMVLSLIAGCCYMAIILGVGTVVAFFGAFLVSGFLLVIVYSWRMRVIKELMEAKDHRIALLKNVIQNVSYIKMRAWECFYSSRIYRLRDYEIKKLLLNSYIIAIMIFVNWFIRSLSLAAVLLYKSFINSSNFGFNEISAFLRIFDLIRTVLLQLPWSVAYLIDLNVSIVRISEFLSAKDLDKTWIQQAEIGHLDNTLMSAITQGQETSEGHADYNPDYAVILENGYFEWVKRLTEEEEEAKKKKEEESKKRMKKIKKGDRRASDVSAISTMTQNLNNGRASIASQDKANFEKYTLDGKVLPREQDVAFRLKEVNMKIPKGKLVFIIGKVGSGKSSVLYSLVGEMKTSAFRPFHARNDDKDTATKLQRNGSLVFLSEKPWLMPNTIKENILVGKEYDEQRIKTCIQMAQFQHDLDLMSDDIDTMIGEDGMTLSGGQRTRLALTRCIYQE
jgi:ABC-type multidrug transport system fused ATPase/permease subunit